MRVAALDLGSNSTRLLVADVADGSLREVERRNTVTRLGRGVDLTGQLSHDAVEDVCNVVGGYLEVCRAAGVEKVSAIATSAVRDASNGEAFCAELRERFALDATVIDGEEESRLTYRGATNGRPPAWSVLVVDIGGGSTELVVGEGDQVAFHASLQAGTIRHTERYLSTDPPQAAALDSLAADVRGLISQATGGEAPNAGSGIAVAGTPTSLAAVEMELDPYDPERVHGHKLSLVSIQRMLSQLSAMPLERRLEVTGLHPGRAPTIVAGVVILVEAMRAFGLDSIEVSEHDILYGAALAVLQRSEFAT